MSFPAYPAYKDSGVEWLGAVPEHWSVLPVKWVGWLKGGAGFPHDKQGVDSHELDFHKVNALASADSDGVLRSSENTITRETAKQLGAHVFPKETIVFAKVGAALLLGRLRTISAEACLDNNMMGLIVFRGKVSNQFALYSMGTVRFDLIANPGAVPSLNEGQIGNYRLAIPGLPEQTQIARFLDHETARIDALIEEQQRLIELLKEKRQAVISHAVTRGLDPEVPMKDSGVEWLGEVPAHWGTNALNKLTVKITNGYVGPTRDILVESGVPYVQATHIKRGVVNFDDAYFVTPEWSMRMSKSILQEGDVLIVQTGAGTGDVGVVSSREVGYNCHALIILQTEKNILSGVFLGQVLQSRFGQSVLYSIRTGGMHPHLNCGEVKFVKIPVPPLKEQEEISNFVKTFSEQAENLIIEAGATMELLHERRSALISAAVTGKIDVRGWQPPASVPSPELVQEAV